MTYHCYSTLGTKSYKAVVWEYTTQQKRLIVSPDWFFGHTPVFQVDHEKGLTLTEVAEGVSVEDVSSCTDEQTKKLTTVHFGAVFDIKCRQATNLELIGFSDVWLYDLYNSNKFQALRCTLCKQAPGCIHVATYLVYVIFNPLLGACALQIRQWLNVPGYSQLLD